MPVVEVVEARFGLEGPQHLPAAVVEDDHDRIPSVAAAVAELPAGHLEGTVADQDERPRAGRDLDRESFIRAIETIRDYDLGIANALSFSPFDHQGLERVYFTRIKDGKFVLIESTHP